MATTPQCVTPSNRAQASKMPSFAVNNSDSHTKAHRRIRSQPRTSDRIVDPMNGPTPVQLFRSDHLKSSGSVRARFTCVRDRIDRSAERQCDALKSRSSSMGGGSDREHEQQHIAVPSLLYLCCQSSVQPNELERIRTARKTTEITIHYYNSLLLLHTDWALNNRNLH